MTAGPVQGLLSGSGVYVGAAASSHVLNVAVDTTAGDSVVMLIRTASGGAISSVTDSRGNTWVVDSATNTSNARAHQAFTTMDVARLQNGDTITITPASSMAVQAVPVEFSPLLPTGDVTGTNNGGAATSATVSAGTSNYPLDVVVASMAFQGTISSAAATGFTQIADLGSGAMAFAYKVTSTTGTQSAAWSWTTSRAWSGVTRAYKQTLYATASLTLTAATTAAQAQVGATAALDLTAATTTAQARPSATASLTLAAAPVGAGTTATATLDLTAAPAATSARAAPSAALTLAAGSAVATAWLVDTFDRADSSTTLNPASDGGSWTVDGSTYGISSNKAVTLATGGTLARARRNTGRVDADITITNTRSNTSGASLIWFAYDPAAGSGYYLTFDSSSGFGVSLFRRESGVATPETNVSGGGPTTWTGGSATLRVTYDPTTGQVTVYQDGSPIRSWTVGGTPLNGAGNTWVAWNDTQSGTGTWDNFAALAASEVPLTATAELTLTAGPATATASATATADLTLTAATTAASAQPTASAALTLAASAAASTRGSATAQLTLTGSMAAVGAPTGRWIDETGRLIFGVVDEVGRACFTTVVDTLGLHMWAAPVPTSVTATPSPAALTLTATAGGQARPAAAAALSLTAAGAASASALPTGALTLTAAAGATGQASALAVLALAATTAGQATDEAAAALSLTATATATTVAAPAAALLSLTAVGTGRARIAAAATIDLSTGAPVLAHLDAAAALTLTASLAAAAQAQAMAGLTLLATGAVVLGPRRDITVVGSYPGPRFIGAASVRFTGQPGPARFVGTTR